MVRDASERERANEQRGEWLRVSVFFSVVLRFASPQHRVLRDGPKVYAALPNHRSRESSGRAK